MNAPGMTLLLLNGRTVDLRVGSVADAAGQVSTLRPQAAEVLNLLASRPGTLVTKDELMKTVWPGIAVTDDSLVQCIKEIRQAIGDDKHQVITTVVKRGYVLRVEGSHRGATRNSSAKGSEATTSAVPPRAPEQLIPIAVLPFANMSSDPEQEFFADGLSEDLITDLSKVAGLFVIARHSSFVYKGRTIDVRQAARELGVAYIVEGGVRRSASRVRITVQLIDASGGGHIWADRFYRNLGDVFALQDEVVGRIVTALVDALPSARLPPKRRAANIAAYDLFVRGRAMTLLMLPGPKNTARPLLEKALELDPDFADAHAWLAMNLAFQWIVGGQIDERDKILAEAERAVSLDPGNADGYFVRGYALTYNGNLPAGREQFELALKSNPNHADAWLFLADLEVFDGHSGAALRAVDMALQLNPYPHPIYYWLMGFALYAAHRYEDAANALQHTGRETGAQRILAAALAQLGRHEEAREVAVRFMNTFPQFTTRSWAKTQPFRNPDDLQHFINGYVKAGLPE